MVFEARIYDSRLGRFLSTDPWEYKYAWQTPYAYFKNSPVSIIDFRGKGGKDDKQSSSNPNDRGADIDDASEYTVKSGDCVWNIASRHLGGDASDGAIATLQNKIIELNGLNSDGDIKLDQVLLIPTNTNPSPANGSQAEQISTAEGGNPKEATSYDGFTYQINKQFSNVQRSVEQGIDHPGEALANLYTNMDATLSEAIFMALGGFSNELGLDNFTTDVWNENVSDIVDFKEAYDESDAFDKGQYRAVLFAVFARTVVERKIVRGKIVSTTSIVQMRQLVPDGYVKTNFRTRNKMPVYHNKKKNMYISADRDGHNGGAWKGAKTVKALDAKETRLGTYDIDMNYLRP